MALPQAIVPIFRSFRPLFRSATWDKAETLVVGTLLGHGRRTVTSALRQMGQADDGRFSLYHHVLNRAQWSSLAVSQRLLHRIVRTFCPSNALTLVVDETLERRWGNRITKRGQWRDSLQSSNSRSVSTSGLRWIVCAAVVSLPWTRQRWALPFLSMLTTTPAYSEKQGLRHKSIVQHTAQMVSVVRRWLPDTDITLVGDGAYSAIDLGRHCVDHTVRLIAPLRQDARLFAPPPEPMPKQTGRPRVVGARLPNLDRVVADPKTVWQSVPLVWYGGRIRSMTVASGTALWYRTGHTPLPIRWVLVRDSSDTRPVRAFFSTDTTQLPAAIVSAFIARWTIETTFAETRAHLGVETQRQWSDTAIERTTPALLGLYSLVALCAHALHPDGQLPVHQSAWYPKPSATFSDALATVRQHLWLAEGFQTDALHPDLRLLPQAILKRLFDAACVD